ncbi:hypothetical protein CC2G_001533 [Coprinopsis cinerea AmutBmut pab1-1]|nr:hypothetical protein CC2G_001533 [Coprinopsis cinerea AmutBmut pab1-1]
MSAPLTTATQVNQAQASVLTQTTLDATMKRPSPATLVNTKKRKLTLADGSELDLNGSLPITADIMLAMRARIFELEDQLAAQQVKEQSSERPAKRARVSSGAENASGDVSAEAGSSSAPSKEDEKKRKMQVKKILDRLKKDCKAADVKFQGSPKTIKFDEILEFAEFQALFGGKGTLIQPTPQNKPTSTVTIIHFVRVCAHFISPFPPYAHFSPELCTARRLLRG